MANLLLLRARRSRSIAMAGLLIFMTAVWMSCTLRYDVPLAEGTPAKDVAWLDSEFYPFASHFLDTSGGKLHFIDEGPASAAPIVFVHGTPTWSFLYRRVIKDLRDEYRCVAFDHIGFGLSSKPLPAVFGYAPFDHSQNLIRLLDDLDLKDVTLVVHDLGGPIGIGAALARPERVARIVVVNSFAWSLEENQQVRTIDRVLRSSLGEWLYLKRNISPEFLLPGAFSDDFELSSDILRQYTHPFADETTRFGLLLIGRGLLGGSTWYDELWAERQKLESRVQLLVFGLEDEFFGREAFETWKARFPHARAIGLEGVGHFPQEEAPLELVTALRELLTPGVANDDQDKRGAASRSAAQYRAEAIASGTALRSSRDRALTAAWPSAARSAYQAVSASRL